jgi:hypothetical protein
MTWAWAGSPDATTDSVAVRDVPRETHFVGDHDHRHSIGGERLHDVEDFPDQLGIERRSGFVEQHHFGIHRQRPGDAGALLLTSGQLARVFVDLAAETDTFEQCPGVAFRIGAADSSNTCRTFDHVLQHGHVRKQIEGLKHHAHPFANVGDLSGGVLDHPIVRRPAVADELPVEQYFAMIVFFEKIQAAQKRALSGAARSDDHQNLAFPDFEIDALENPILSEALLQIPDLENGVAHERTFQCRSRRWEA